METLEGWLKLWGVGHRTRPVRDGLIELVCECTGVSPTDLIGSGDPTGWKLAHSSLHSGDQAGSPTVQRCRLALGLTADGRVPVMLTWGWTAPHRVPPAPPDRWHCTAQGGSGRSGGYGATRAAARSSGDRIEVGHLWVLKFARP